MCGLFSFALKCYNDYYERNLGVYLTAEKSRHQKLYRKIRAKLEVFGAVKEGKIVIEFLRRFKKTSKDVVSVFTEFFKVLIAGIIIILKIVKRIITKPFRKRG